MVQTRSMERANRMLRNNSLSEEQQPVNGNGVNQLLRIRLVIDDLENHGNQLINEPTAPIYPQIGKFTVIFFFSM